MAEARPALAPPRTILISIQPRFASLIFEGRKRFELRRVAPRLAPGDRALVYASSPRRAVIGRFRVGRVVAGTPAEVWAGIGGAASGLGEGGFFAYLREATRCAAIEVQEPVLLEAPLALPFRAPQSYLYLDPAETAHAALLAGAGLSGLV